MKTHSITLALEAWTQGETDATQRLFSEIYPGLQRRARGLLGRERPNHTLEPNALVHEAFLRMPRPKQVQWQNREHLFGGMSREMRRVLVDHARRKGAVKRGKNPPMHPLDEALGVPDERAVHRPALHDALTLLKQVAARQHQVVIARFYFGHTIEETAEALGISPATVRKDWEKARDFLARELWKGAHHV